MNDKRVAMICAAVIREFAVRDMASTKDAWEVADTLLYDLSSGRAMVAERDGDLVVVKVGDRT